MNGVGFGGARFLPSSEPQRLGQTPLSGTQVPQRLLTRLSPGRLCLPPADARPKAQTPEFVGSERSSARPHCALAGRSANGLTLRCGRRRSSDDPPGRSLVSRSAPEELSRFVRTPARRMFVGPLLSLRGNSGEASCRPTWVGAASLALAPAQSARCLGRREKGVPLLLGALRACAALRRVASGISR